MSRKFDQSELRPYKSAFKEGYITEADYICELLFIRRKEYDRSGSLPQKFWNTDKYRQLYVGQIVNIKRLLREYSGFAVVTAVRGSRALSITNKELLRDIERIDAKQKRVQKVIKKVEPSEAKPIRPRGNKNRLDEL